LWLAFGALVGAQAQASQTPDRAALAASFKEYIARNIKSYETDHHQHIREVAAGWVKTYRELKPDYSIDLRVTDSLITPYLGTCAFTLIEHQTTPHDTKDGAEKDNDFVDGSTWQHRHNYSYEEGKWVPVSRQCLLTLLDGEAPLHFDEEKWEDCDEINVKTQEYASDPRGCWELGAKYPIKRREQ
jgi:hypothetical protein